MWDVDVDVTRISWTWKANRDPVWRNGSMLLAAGRALDIYKRRRTRLIDD